VADDHDPKSANRQACALRLPPLIYPNRRSPGKSSIRSSDGSTLPPRTSQLVSQISSRPWSGQISLKKLRLHRPRATTPVGTKTLVEAQDGRRRRHSRLLPSKRVTLARCPNLQCHQVPTLGGRLMDLMVVSAPLWPAKRIDAAEGEI
jgi:hypothetical protein